MLFRSVYPEPSVPSNLTSERNRSQVGDLWNNILAASPKPEHGCFHLMSAPGLAADNYSAWYTSPSLRGCDAMQAWSLRDNDWSFLKSELERISRFGDNWDGEGAERISEESVATALSLLNAAKDVTRKVAEQNEPFRWQISTFGEPEITKSLTTLRYSLDLEPSTATQLMRDAWSAIRARIFAESVPGLYPTVEGGVTLKWIHRGKELQCTALGSSIEVIRWKSSDAYDSDGLWDLNVEQTREHFEWLMR